MLSGTLSRCRVQTEAMSEVARIVEYSGARPGKQVWTWCPGCNSLHPFTIEAPPGVAGEQLNRGVTWEWDGNLDAPTFSPSLLVHSAVHLCEGEHDPEVCEDPEGCEARSHLMGWRREDGTINWKANPETTDEVHGHANPEHTRNPAWGSCHSFLRAGRWEFLDDSAHGLAGQTVDMVPLPRSHREDNT